MIDLSSGLIATELGIIVTDPSGNSLNSPLDTHTNIAWIGYANNDIRRQIEPAAPSFVAKAWMDLISD